MILETLQQAADALGLSLYVFLGITGTISFIALLLIVNQAVATFGDNKPTAQWKCGLEGATATEKKQERNSIVIAGPEFAGKTLLFY